MNVNKLTKRSKKMYKNESIKNSIVGVESAENFRELKEAIVDVIKVIDREISYMDSRRRGV